MKRELRRIYTMTLNVELFICEIPEWNFQSPEARLLWNHSEFSLEPARLIFALSVGFIEPGFHKACIWPPSRQFMRIN